MKQRKTYEPNVTLALPYLRAIQRDSGLMFPWEPHHRRTLDVEFHKLQRAAGIALPCPNEGRHECTETCSVYGWHGFRYAHATYNYGRVSDRELMHQMGHSSRAMMDYYARIARLNQARVYNGFVPGAGAKSAQSAEAATST